MRIANLSGRLAIVRNGHAIDVERASSGRFSSDPQAVYGRWAEFLDWAGTVSDQSGVAFEARELQAPAPAPRQLFAIGLNYSDHVNEVGISEDMPRVVQARGHRGRVRRAIVVGMSGGDAQTIRGLDVVGARRAIDAEDVVVVDRASIAHRPHDVSRRSLIVALRAGPPAPFGWLAGMCCFRTVHLPRGRQPLRDGVDERVPAGWVNRLFYPFRRRQAPAGSS